MGGQPVAECLSSIWDSNGHCIDEGCRKWDDGCNVCSVDRAASKLACTKKRCEQLREPRCVAGNSSDPDDDKASCEDDQTWKTWTRMGSKKRARSCAWVSKNTDLRCKRLSGKQGDSDRVPADAACRKTCGKCTTSCADDPTWVIKDDVSKSKRRQRGCSWLSEKRTKQRCNNIVSAANVPAKQACPNTCGQCSETMPRRMALDQEVQGEQNGDEGIYHNEHIDTESTSLKDTRIEKQVA